MHMPTYKVISFRGRHIGFSISGLVGQYLDLSHSNAGPLKCRSSRRNFDSISSRSWDMCFRFGGQHIGFSTSSSVGQYLNLPHSNAGPQKCRCSCRNFVSISSRSWDIHISGLEAAILDFPLPVWFRLSPFFPRVTGHLKYRVFRWNRLSILSTSLYIDSTSL